MQTTDKNQTADVSQNHIDGKQVTGYCDTGEAIAFQTATPNKAKHSPLPWSEQGGIITAGISPGQPYIADCRFGPAGHRNANAKLIVRAVNHADKLAEVLRDLRTRVVAERPDCLNTTKADEALAAYEADQ